MSVFLLEAIGQIKAISARILELQRGPPEERCLIFQEYVSMLNGESMKAIAEASIYYRSELKQLEKEDLELDVSSPNFLRSREVSRRRRSLLRKKQEDSKVHGLKAGRTEIELEIGREGIRKEGETSETHDGVEWLFSGHPRSTAVSPLSPSISFIEELYEMNAQIQHSWGVVLSVAMKSQPEEEDYHESIVADYENLFDCSSSYLRAWLLKGGNGSSIANIICFFQLVNGYVTADVVTSAFHQIQAPQKLEDLKAVLNCMQDCRIPVTVRIAELLEKGLVRCMKSEGAEKVYHFMVSECSLTPLTTRPFALLFNDKSIPVSRVLNYYEEMLDYGIQPELSTLRLLCNKCKNDSKWIRTHFTLLSVAKDEESHSYSHKLDEKGVNGNIPASSSTPFSYGGAIGTEGVESFTNPKTGNAVDRPSHAAVLFFVNRLSAFATGHGLSFMTTGDLISKSKSETSSATSLPSVSDVASSLPSVTETGESSSPLSEKISGGVSLLDAMRILHRCEVEGRNMQREMVLVSNLILLICAGTSTPLEDLVLPFSQSKAYYPPRVCGGISSSSLTSSMKMSGSSHLGVPPAFPTSPPRPSLDDDVGEAALQEGKHAFLKAGVQSGGAVGDIGRTNALLLQPEKNAKKRLESPKMGGESGIAVAVDIHEHTSNLVGEWSKDDEGEREDMHSKFPTNTIFTDHLTPQPQSPFTFGTPPPVSSLSLPSASGMATATQEVQYLLDVMRDHFQWEMVNAQLFASLLSIFTKRNCRIVDEVVELLLLYHFRHNRERCAAMAEKLLLPVSVTHTLTDHDESGKAVVAVPLGACVWVSPTPCVMCRFLVERYTQYHQRLRVKTLAKEVLQQYYDFTAVYHIPWDVVKSYRFPESRHDTEENERDGKDDASQEEVEGRKERGAYLHDTERAEGVVPHSLDSTLRTPHHTDPTFTCPYEEASSGFSLSNAGEWVPDSASVALTMASPHRSVSKSAGFWEPNSRSIRRLFFSVMQRWRNVDWCLGWLVAGLIISDAPLSKEMQKWVLFFYTPYVTSSGDGEVPTGFSVGEGGEPVSSSGEEKDDSSVPMHRDSYSTEKNSFLPSSSRIPPHVFVIDEIIRCDWCRENIFQSSLLMYGQENSTTYGSDSAGNENGFFASPLRRGPTSAGQEKTERMELEEEGDKNKNESPKLINIVDQLWDSSPAVRRETTSSVVIGDHGHEGEPRMGEGQADPAILHQRLMPLASTATHMSAASSAGGTRERADNTHRTLEYYLQNVLRDIRMPRPIIDWYRKRLFSIASELSRSPKMVNENVQRNDTFNMVA